MGAKWESKVNPTQYLIHFKQRRMRHSYITRVSQQRANNSTFRLWSHLPKLIAKSAKLFHFDEDATQWDEHWGQPRAVDWFLIWISISMVKFMHTCIYQQCFSNHERLVIFFRLSVSQIKILTRIRWRKSRSNTRSFWHWNRFTFSKTSIHGICYKKRQSSFRSEQMCPNRMTFFAMRKPHNSAYHCNNKISLLSQTNIWNYALPVTGSTP